MSSLPEINPQDQSAFLSMPDVHHFHMMQYLDFDDYLRLQSTCKLLWNGHQESIQQVQQATGIRDRRITSMIAQFSFLQRAGKNIGIGLLNVRRIPSSRPQELNRWLAEAVTIVHTERDGTHIFLKYLKPEQRKGSVVFVENFECITQRFVRTVIQPSGWQKAGIAFKSLFGKKAEVQYRVQEHWVSSTLGTGTTLFPGMFSLGPKGANVDMCRRMASLMRSGKLDCVVPAIVDTPEERFSVVLLPKAPVAQPAVLVAKEASEEKDGT